MYHRGTGFQFSHSVFHRRLLDHYLADDHNFHPGQLIFFLWFEGASFRSPSLIVFPTQKKRGIFSCSAAAIAPAATTIRRYRQPLHMLLPLTATAPLLHLLLTQLIVSTAHCHRTVIATHCHHYPLPMLMPLAATPTRCHCHSLLLPPHYHYQLPSGPWTPSRSISSQQAMVEQFDSPPMSPPDWRARP